MDEIYDLLVIGGGINGVGIARDAAGRGGKVILAEKDDLASHTSSSSTKLIHGGLRYLEHYEFRLVRESLIERERLLAMAPHIIWPLRFVLPHDKGLRPAWMLRLGLFLYDHLGGRKFLPATRSVNLRKAGGNAQMGDHKDGDDTNRPPNSKSSERGVSGNSTSESGVSENSANECGVSGNSDNENGDSSNVTRAHEEADEITQKQAQKETQKQTQNHVLQDRLIRGFEYSDCWVNDARLVALSAVDAAERGADIRTRTRCSALKRRDDLWVAELIGPGGRSEQICARAVVNAAGPWVDGVLGLAKPDQEHQNLRLVKGSHLIFPRLYEGEHAYIFQNRDNRILFTIPYEGKFTLVGTTDQAFSGDPGDIDISPEEAAYICDAISEYFVQPIRPDAAIWSYAGVRPLYDDKSADNSTVTRDYVFEIDDQDADGNPAPPILSIFGGKITTYRKLAEHALRKLKLPALSDSSAWTGAWTAGAPLPGGDMAIDGFEPFVSQMRNLYSWFPAGVMRRLARAYGTRLTQVIGDATCWADMGTEFGSSAGEAPDRSKALGLTERELHYLIDHEFARNAEDVLWRRSKLGLHMQESERQAVEDWFQTRNSKS